MSNQIPAILRAVDASGNVSFWTGRAGQAWVSPDRAEAFTGLNMEGARRKALKFNQMTAAHGLRFIAVQRDPL